MAKPVDVDHLVLPVGNIETASRRLSSLGFTLAPLALHPFGTQNACIFFEDGTYLEPLVIADPDKYRASIAAGDVFTGRDQAFRNAHGSDGFSALVAKTDDALADHQRFVETGISAGDVFDFSRPVTLPDGSQSEASFRLAFAAEGSASDFFFFACQRVKALPGDRSALVRHENGVIGLSEIQLVSDDPSAAAPLVEAVFQVDRKVSPDGDVLFEAGNVDIYVASDLMSPSASGADETGEKNGLRGATIVFSTADIAVTEAVLAANGVPHMREGARLMVPAAPGQGVAFAFEEK